MKKGERAEKNARTEHQQEHWPRVIDFAGIESAMYWPLYAAAWSTAERYMDRDDIPDVAVDTTLDVIRRFREAPMAMKGETALQRDARATAKHMALDRLKRQRKQVEWSSEIAVYANELADDEADVSELRRVINKLVQAWSALWQFILKMLIRGDVDDAVLAPALQMEEQTLKNHRSAMRAALRLGLLHAGYDNIPRARSKRKTAAANALPPNPPPEAPRSELPHPGDKVYNND